MPRKNIGKSIENMSSMAFHFDFLIRIRPIYVPPPMPDAKAAVVYMLNKN